MNALRWHERGYDVRLDGTLLICRCQVCDEHLVFSAAFGEGLVDECLDAHALQAHPQTRLLAVLEMRHLEAMLEASP